MNRGKLYILQLLVVVLLASCNKKNTLFTMLDSDVTNIDFENIIVEDSINNMFNFMNIYTGAGVGVSDINNDGLVDIFFSGNIVSNKLYLNKGNFKFEDISESSGIESNKWCTGVSMVDINQDGWMDIYVTVSGSGSTTEKENLLYINQKDNTFKEEAKKYGLADSSQTTHSAFFDYDGDGDLDVFLIVNPANYKMSNVNMVRPRLLNGESESTDKLYRNNGDGTFSDVSKEAGVLIEGYSLGVGVNDINNDGFPDVYVSNDFLTNDIMYINKGDGTFSDKSHYWLKHTSFAGMGNDLSDINNDGNTDIIVLDMLPEDNKRHKLIIPYSSYDKQQLLKANGYQNQYTRNTLQLNNGDDTFSEIGLLSGISSTDWSWSVLMADYNNDSKKDIFITNGFARDVGNMDYIHFKQQSFQPFGTNEARKNQEIEAIKNAPIANIKNYFFKNNGDLTFSDVSESWGIKEANLSNGSAFADLDNDGDLDIIVSNINSKAGILQNRSETASTNHYLKIQLQGHSLNLNGIGTKIRVSSAGSHQYYQHFLSRGYQSSIDNNIHFGLGNNAKTDSIEVIWPDGKLQIIYDIKNDTEVSFDYKNAKVVKKPKSKPNDYLFESFQDSLGIIYTHEENNFIDFKIQPIIPHMHSRQGPKLAVGDINNDGLDDFFVGGAKGYTGKFFVQKKQGVFDLKNLEADDEYEDVDAVLFDADNDGDLDLYVVSGGTEQMNKEKYQDRLYLNDGTGSFERSEGLIPEIKSSGSIVIPADYDKDGDIDLFVGGRVEPGNYPMSPESYLLQNTNGVFINIANKVDGGIQHLGMVTSAIWSDYNGDSELDLIVVGEFMQIRVFKNEMNGGFEEVTESVGLEKTHGWWNSIAQGDFDNDGDIDYVAGNWGMNSRYKASSDEPLCIYAKDYDSNGQIDPIMCYYNDGENYIFHTRDALIDQINGMKGRFKTYTSYAETKFEDSFTKDELKDAYVVKSEMFRTSYLENMGENGFKLHFLPIEAQFAPVNALKVIDLDNDGNLDVVMAGNNSSGNAAIGDYDAMTGLCLMGNGKGEFKALISRTTGFYAGKDVKDIKLLDHVSKGKMILVANNSDSLKVYKIK